jgi:protein transport protein SEC24
MAIARQNIDGTEIELGDMLVEDENNANMSYLDCQFRLSLTDKKLIVLTDSADLCHVHRQIHTVVLSISAS